MREADPVDRALQSLGGRHWPGETHNPKLENQLMRAFETNKPASLISRHRVLIPVLAILVFGSVAFAAAGGIGFVKSLFVTVSVNGEVVDTSEVVLDENGRGTFTVPIDASDDTQTLELTLEGECTGVDGGMVTIETTALAQPGADKLDIEIQVEENEEE